MQRIRSTRERYAVRRGVAGSPQVRFHCCTLAVRRADAGWKDTRPCERQSGYALVWGRRLLEFLRLDRQGCIRGERGCVQHIQGMSPAVLRTYRVSRDYIGHPYQAQGSGGRILTNEFRHVLLTIQHNTDTVRELRHEKTVDQAFGRNLARSGKLQCYDSICRFWGASQDCHEITTGRPADDQL